MRAADRGPIPTRRAFYPGDKPAVIEAQREFHLHAHTATNAAHDAHDMRVSHARLAMARRHEVCDRDFATADFVRGFEDQCLRKISASGLSPRGGSDEPAAVVFCSKQRGETCGGIKMR